MTRRSVVMIVVALATGCLTAAQAQTQGASSQGDIMPALLAEVRGLRIAVEQMTAAGPRVQLALGRLQLQEQRVAAATTRLADTRTQLAGMQRRAAEVQEAVDTLEGMLSGEREMAKPDAKNTAEDIRRMVSAELAMRQKDVSVIGVDIQRLTHEEAALANELSTEQARWSDQNQRLEDLERALRPLK